MVSPFQGRPPTNQPFPPANRQPFNWGGPYQQGAFPETTPEKTGIQGMIQKFLPNKSVGNPGVGSTGSSGGLSGTLDNIQQILKMSQSVTPLIQQYAPMVKNLPAMLTLLKAFQESDEIDGTTTEDDSKINESVEELEDEVKQEKVVVNESKDDLYQIETEAHTPVKKTNRYQTSKPKLYI
ncbi:hypothetical protein GCM10011351_06410 [Paraliobacillus quinghaiensis]|uniref:YqfQ-like protein n=1 Tax=Paraliobacillus quinghaiensis TaxID=470815 RepID=A0A917WRH6_9BACI|nr:VrrA/YqfQ family protein [Paraliobacillus quinghaiensis]GGM23324.1 hypothetical protein GCM10011351_06410 [Paraliobacillus quinghaiensis]